MHLRTLWLAVGGRQLNGAYNSKKMARSTDILSSKSTTRDEPTVLLAGSSKQIPVDYGFMLEKNRRQRNYVQNPEYRSTVAQVPPYRHEATMVS